MNTQPSRFSFAVAAARDAATASCPEPSWETFVTTAYAREHRNVRKWVALVLGGGAAILADLAFSTYGYPLGQRAPMSLYLTGLAFVVLAGVLASFRSPRTTALSVAVLWSLVAVGSIEQMVLSMVEMNRPVFVNSARISHAVLVLVSGTGLWILRRRGHVLDSDTTFRPVAFRGRFRLSLTLAAVDTIVLLYSALIGNSTLAWGMAALMAVGTLGLLRLRAWSMLLIAGMNIVVAGLALGPLSLPTVGNSTVLFFTAIVQLMLPIPVVRAMLGAEVDESRLEARSWSRQVGNGLLLLAMGGAAVMLLRSFVVG